MKNAHSYDPLGGTVRPQQGAAVPVNFGLVLGVLFLLILIEPTISAAVFAHFGFIDEATLLFVYALIMYRVLLRGKIVKAQTFALFWVFYCLLISLLFGVNRSAADILQQGFIQSKLIVFSIGAILLFNDGMSARVMRWAIYLILLGGILSVLLPEIFLAISESERFREGGLFGLPPAIGFQMQPNRLGRVLAAVPLLTAAQIGVSRLRFQVIFALSLFLVLMSGGRIAVVLFMVFSFLRFYFLTGSNSQRALVFVSLVPVVFLTLAYVGYGSLRLDQFGSGAVTGDDAPIFRVILLIDGLTLARDHFPIGAGLAAFGTPFSLDQNTYDTLLTGQSFFFERGTVLDNNYASIIGETGFFGSLILFGALVILLTFALRNAHRFAKIGVPLYLLVILAFESAMQAGITSAFFALVLRAVSQVR